MKKVSTRKTYNEQLNDPAKKTKYFDIEKDTPQYVAKWGKTGILPSPVEINDIMKEVPVGFLVTADAIKCCLAQKHGVDSVCPVTFGIYANLCAKASVEREDKDFPYWRMIKENGELCEKFPCGVDGQRRLLELEGHRITQKGKKFFVEDYEKRLWNGGAIDNCGDSLYN